MQWVNINITLGGGLYCCWQWILRGTRGHGSHHGFFIKFPEALESRLGKKGEIRLSVRAPVVGFRVGILDLPVKVSKTGVVSWLCSNQQTKSCYAVIQAKDNVLNHSCLWRKPTLMPCVIFMIKLRTFYEMSWPQTLKRSLRRNQYKSQGKTKEPNTWENISFDGEVLKMTDGMV